MAQLCPTICDPMDCSTPGLPVHHQLPEFTQTHVHRVGDAIQSSHPLLSPSPPALNLSQHQGLFKWVSSLHQVSKGLEFQLQHQSFQWTFRTDFLYDGLVGSPCSPRDSQESSPIPQQNFLSLFFPYWCCNKTPQTWWVNNTPKLFYHSGGQTSKMSASSVGSRRKSIFLFFPVLEVTPFFGFWPHVTPSSISTITSPTLTFSLWSLLQGPLW